MTFTNIKNNQSDAVRAFQGFNVDDQLALLWYLYKDIGSQISPEPNANSTGSPIAGSWFDQVKQASKEEQLQIQRDIATRQDTEYSRQYGSLDSSTKLFFWYLLAQGMEEGSIIQVPSNYSLPKQAQQFLEQLKPLSLEDKITFAKSVVLPMGSGSPQSTQI
ncbi:MAG: Orange carotenoid protein [Leptolyngbyaceae cyanobacterium RM1_406_9]|nr:Orange carotenoid protein [Leptolyngbyaceae cyanobacterium RM1_406_9]